MEAIDNNEQIDRPQDLTRICYLHFELYRALFSEDSSSVEDKSAGRKKLCKTQCEMVPYANNRVKPELTMSIFPCIAFEMAGPIGMHFTHQLGIHWNAYPISGKPM